MRLLKLTLDFGKSQIFGFIDPQEFVIRSREVDYVIPRGYIEYDLKIHLIILKLLGICINFHRFLRDVINKIT